MYIRTISTSVFLMSVIFASYHSEGRNIFISDSFQQASYANRACGELFYPSNDSFVNITNSPLFIGHAWIGNSLNATTGTCLSVLANSTGDLIYCFNTDCRKLLPVLCAKLIENLLTPIVQDFKMDTIFLILCIIAAVIGLIVISTAVWCVRRWKRQKTTGSIKDTSAKCDATEAIMMSVLESNNAYTDIDTENNIGTGKILDDGAYHKLDHSRKDHLEDKCINVYDHQQSIRNRDGIYDLSGETQLAILKHDSDNYDLVNVSLSIKLGEDQN